METTINIVPKDLVIQIALDLSLSDLINWCLTSKKFNKIICDNEFWYLKFVKTYSQQVANGIKINAHWRDIYKDHMSIWVTGSNQHGQLGLQNKDIMLLTSKRLPNIKAKQVTCNLFVTIIIDHRE